MQAKGKFTVKMDPLPPKPAEGIAGFALAKVFDGDLEGTSVGEMMTAGDPTHGTSGYVALERVMGTLGGKTGSFVFQHSSTMNAGKFEQSIVVTPGSATGGLAGLSGSFVIHQADHTYTFTYELPA